MAAHGAAARAGGTLFTGAASAASARSWACSAPGSCGCAWAAWAWARRLLRVVRA